MSQVCGTGGQDVPRPEEPDWTGASIFAQPVYNGIRVWWTFPAINSQAVAHFNLYRAATSDPLQKIKIVTLLADSYIDEIHEDDPLTYYYWVEGVSIYGVKSSLIGPVTATSEPLVEKILQKLQNQITSSHLFTDLNTEINKVALIDAALNNEIINRQTEDGFLSQSIQSVQYDGGEYVGLVANEQQARIDADEALVQEVNTVLLKTDANEAAIQQEATLRENADNEIFGQYTVKIDANGHVAGYGLASSPSHDDDTNTSDFIVNADRFAITHPANIWQANTSYALDTVVKPTGTGGNGLIYKVTQAGTSGGTEPTWPSVVNGTVNDNTVIFTAIDSGTTVPFVVQDGTVYMDGAMIKDATIDEAKIKTLSIDGVHIKPGVITADKISTVLQSDNFVSGQSGWQIKRSGDAEFNGAVISRQIVADSGTYTNSGSHNTSFTGYPAHLLSFHISTAIPLAAWQAPDKSYIAAASIDDMYVETYTGYPPDVEWGFYVRVLPLTRWTGPQYVRLALEFWGKHVKRIAPGPGDPYFQVHWTVYEVI